MRTAIDTNVLSALWRIEPTAPRLLELLHEARLAGSIVLCAAAYAETFAHPGVTESFVSNFLADTRIQVDFQMEESVWVEAGRRFADYAERRRRAIQMQPKRILADFLIGAHALITADRLITLDQRLYRRDFPSLLLL